MIPELPDENNNTNLYKRLCFNYKRKPSAANAIHGSSVREVRCSIDE